jgi:hypothetical protein
VTLIKLPYVCLLDVSFIPKNPVILSHKKTPITLFSSHFVWPLTCTSEGP